jgi:hypothetical protein
MADGQYLANPDVACQPSELGVTLYNRDSDELLEVNAVGVLVWQYLSRARAVPQIATRVVEAYRDAPDAQVVADVEAFLVLLQEGGFVGQVLLEGDSIPAASLTQGQRCSAKTLCAQTPSAGKQPYYYQGCSMSDVFLPGDLLTITPAVITGIRPGDVVIYRWMDRKGQSADVVHRVVAVQDGGLVTRGDNNPQPDSRLVTEAMLLGRVTSVQRGYQSRRVQGGGWGLFQADVRRAWRSVKRSNRRWISRLGGQAYRWVRQRNLARRLWRPRLVRLLLASERGPLIKFICNQRTVATWEPDTGRFQCRKPYDLIIRRPDCGF